MANEMVPFWEPADHVTAVVGTGGVTGKKFVAPAAGALVGGLGTAGGSMTVVLPGAGVACLGVAAQDAAAGTTVMVQTEGIVPVTTAAALTAGQRVQCDATGAAIVFAAGVPLGLCVGDTASGSDAPIKLVL